MNMGGEAPGDRPDELARAAMAETVCAPCWRCDGPMVASASHCPACFAPNRDRPLPCGGSPDYRARVAATESTLGRAPVVMLTVVFLGLSLTNVALAYLYNSAWGQDDNASRDFGPMIPPMALFSAVDAILVAGVFFYLFRRTRQPGTTTTAAVIAWLLLVPLLAACLGLNEFYHEALRDFIGLKPTAHWEDWQDHWAWAVLLVCVMPAVFEELCFRQLVLGSMRRVMGLHAAVLLSGVMFGLAHIGAPLSVPYLALRGAVSM